MPESIKRESLKIHIMPESVHSHYVNNDLIDENEIYLVEDNSTVLSIREGGTGVAATSVAEVRSALGVAAADHSSTEASCGIGSNLKYGHLKLSNSIDSDLGINDGVAATPAAIKELHKTVTDTINNNTTTLDDELKLKAPLASPALTGIPTAPTATSGTNTTQIATTEFVQNAVSDLSKNGISGNAASASAVPWSGVQSKPTTLSGYGITDAVNSSEVVTVATANKILKLNSDAKLPADITGNSATATKLATQRTISLTGQASGSGKFDGSGDMSISVTIGPAFVISSSAPTDKNKIWIDSGKGNLMKVYNGSSWIGISAVFA